MTERHPWPPFIPHAPRFLVLGTFPPKPERWAMEFYYPNRINDFWRIAGLIFFNDRDHFWVASERRFDLDAIKRLLEEQGIAMWDTAMEVRRLKDNASDKYLEIVEEIDLARLLHEHPGIAHVVTAGEKATGVVAAQAGIAAPAMGQTAHATIAGHDFLLHRLPSSSRAFPMKLETKAEFYRKVFVNTP